MWLRVKAVWNTIQSITQFSLSVLPSSQGHKVTEVDSSNSAAPTAEVNETQNNAVNKSQKVTIVTYVISILMN